MLLHDFNLHKTMLLGAYLICLLACALVIGTSSNVGMGGPSVAGSWIANESSEKYVLSASILSADFARLGDEVRNALTAGADVIHFDVMDGQFVPGLTIGPVVCKALRDFGVSKDIDVHLMTKPVDSLIEEFANAGASYITIHPEATSDLTASLSLIRFLGCKAGLAISPDCSVDVCKDVLHQLDLILVMGVQPGKGGQSFMPSTLEKIAKVRKLIDTSGCNIRLSVDGGVKPHNIREIALAGADTFVVGSALFKAPRTTESYTASIKELRGQLDGL